MVNWDDAVCASLAWNMASPHYTTDYKNIMNRVKRKRLEKQTIALPVISPSVSKYGISETIDFAISA